MQEKMARLGERLTMSGDLSAPKCAIYGAMLRWAESLIRDKIHHVKRAIASGG